VRRERADRTLIAAGLATIALGTLLLLDRTGVIDVRFDYLLPALLAAVGAVLVTAGLSR
jgi:cell wall-active antibiotic response 4TMS protein YvqF